MKRVVHIIVGLGDGGAEGVLTRLILNSENFSHVVISLTDYGKYGHPLSESGVSVYALGIQKPLAAIFSVYRLYTIIKSEKPDIVQTWMYHADLLGGLAARLAGVKRIVWGIRHSNFKKGASSKVTVLIARLCALMSRYIPHSIVCCANNAKEAHVRIGYDSKKMVVIPNGYDLSMFRPFCGDAFPPSLFPHFFTDTMKIGMIGRNNPQKNHEGLLHSLYILKSSIPYFYCFLVGPGVDDGNNTLKRLIKRLGLEDHVKMVGATDDVPNVMNSLELTVLSSSFGEGFPNVIAESMACGTPCVATDVGDASEIIGDCGWIVPANDDYALSSALKQAAHEYYDRPDLWSLRKRGCVARISQNFSVSDMVGAFERVWE